jgi:hypothetical protein
MYHKFNPSPALLIDASLHRDSDDKVSHRGTLLPNGREIGYALHGRVQHALKGPDVLRGSTQPTLREQFAALEFRADSDRGAEGGFNGANSGSADLNGRSADGPSKSTFTEWSLDNPYLYRLEIRLSEVDDTELRGDPADGVWLGVRGEANAGNEPGGGVLLYDGAKVDRSTRTLFQILISENKRIRWTDRLITIVYDSDADSDSKLSLHCDFKEPSLVFFHHNAFHFCIL